MENASKALIIAGAILLSILIIALGIFIFNAAKGAVNTEQLDATAIQAFNSPFEQYEGLQSGINVKTLISNVISNYGTNSGDSNRQPSVIYHNTAKGAGMNLGGTLIVNKSEDKNLTIKNSKTKELGLLRSKLVASRNYEVTFEYNKMGLVSKIHITYK